MKDYSQIGDPYRIAAEYTAQSATTDVVHPIQQVGLDVRGNQMLKPRSLPTQAEADAIMRGL
jgi:hypothetical protein